MNQRQEAFSRYWEECLNGVIYGAACEKGPLGLLSASAVKRLVLREVWELRFGSGRIQHGAFRWLQSLEQEDPQLGGAVRHRIQSFQPRAGFSPAAWWSAAAGIAALAAAVLSIRHWPVWAVGSAAGAAFLGLGASAWLLMRSSDVRGTLTEAFEKEKQVILEILKE